jgi:hypothetical protein
VKIQPWSGPNTLRARVLRALANVDFGLSTVEFLTTLGDTGERHLLLVKYANTLGEMNRLGFVDRAGYRGGGWQRRPSPVWVITEAGRARLAEYDALPDRTGVA